MAELERVREEVAGSLDAEYVKQRERAGWRLVAVEWQREMEGAAPEPGPRLEEAPYGVHVADDCGHLAEDSDEMKCLLSMMELIIQDISIVKVAEELNRKGFRTRKGTDWGPVAVFNMLPRLIELTPRIFASEEWVERRKKLTLVY